MFWPLDGSNIRATMSTAPPEIGQKARRGLGVYFAVLILGSAFLEWRILQTRELIGKHPGLILMLMYTPTVASVIARLALREGFKDVSFRFGGRLGAKAALLAWVYPLWVGFIAYGIAWTARLAQFQAPIPQASRFFAANPTGNFLWAVLLTATVGTIFSCASAAGEEIGWRGYMLTRLIDAGVPKPVLVSGLIWGSWHLPLILSGQYATGAHPRISALLFLVDIVAAGYLAAYVRLKSGSVWPAVLFHGAWNAIIQAAFDRATVDKPLAVGESGYIVAAASVLTVAWLVRRRWDMLRSPTEQMAAPGRF